MQLINHVAQTFATSEIIQESVFFISLIRHIVKKKVKNPPEVNVHTLN